jgi:predicted signal transduction protein with EAL and GGDEF domain
VTESALAEDPELALSNLDRLRALGCDIAIDDYGTGYSSLAYVERLPLTELKIDKGFVLNMLKSHQDESIVHSTIDLAHRLGLRVTAEGVDSIDALQRLQSFGCDTAQGFFLCRPVPAAAMETWYREGRDRVHVPTRHQDSSTQISTGAETGSTSPSATALIPASVAPVAAIATIPAPVPISSKGKDLAGSCLLSLPQ